MSTFRSASRSLTRGLMRGLAERFFEATTTVGGGATPDQSITFQDVSNLTTQNTTDLVFQG